MWPSLAKLGSAADLPPEALFFPGSKAGTCTPPQYLVCGGCDISLFLQHKQSERCGGEWVSALLLLWDCCTSFCVCLGFLLKVQSPCRRFPTVVWWFILYVDSSAFIRKPLLFVTSRPCSLLFIHKTYMPLEYDGLDEVTQQHAECFTTASYNTKIQLTQ